MYRAENTFKCKDFRAKGQTLRRVGCGDGKNGSTPPLRVQTYQKILSAIEEYKRDKQDSSECNHDSIAIP